MLESPQISGARSRRPSTRGAANWPAGAEARYSRSMQRILVTAGALAGLFGARRLRDRRRREALATRRRGASADALAAEVRASMFARRVAIPGAARLLAQADAWTDVGLLAALDALHGEAMREDERTGMAGREGAVSAFYDAGLAAMSEVLARRIAAAR